MSLQDSNETQGQQQPQDAIEQRLAALEQVLASQQERIAQQEQIIQELRVAQGHAAEVAAPRSDLILPPSAQKQARAAHPSRRSLLKVGGVAAAAAAVGAAAAAAMRPQVASAAGTAWATGTVNADVETLVKPSGSGYSASDILQLRLGTGTPFQPLSGGMKSALTAYDTTSQNVGVYGTSQTGYGLYGVTESGSGATGAGLNGSGRGTGTGVAGQSGSGIGVQGNSNSGLGGSFTGGQAPIALGAAGFAGPPTSGVHIQGELFVDSNGTIWVCQAAGDFTVGPAPVFYPLSGIVLLPAPVRVVGGTTSYKGLPGVQINGGDPGPTYTFSVDAKVPPYAKAMLGNATCHSMPGAGHLDLWPAGVARPLASTVNYVPSDVPLSNFCIVGLGASGSSQRAFIVGSYQTCGFLYDLTGYIV